MHFVFYFITYIKYMTNTFGADNTPEKKDRKYKPFDGKMLNEFGNRYVANLLNYTVSDAINLPKTGDHSMADELVEQKNDGTIGKVDCEGVTEFLDTIEDEGTKKNLQRGTRALMKHVRWNIQFG